MLTGDGFERLRVLHTERNPENAIGYELSGTFIGATALITSCTNAVNSCSAFGSNGAGRK